MGTKRIDFFDNEESNISDLVKITNGKGSPWHSSSVFTYEHPILGNIDIGYHSSGSIDMNDGYSHKETEI